MTLTYRSRYRWALPQAHPVQEWLAGRLLTDGYSCRSPVKIVDGLRLPHPVEILRHHLAASPTAGQRTTPLTA